MFCEELAESFSLLNKKLNDEQTREMLKRRKAKYLMQIDENLQQMQENFYVQFLTNRIRITFKMIK